MNPNTTALENETSSSHVIQCPNSLAWRLTLTGAQSHFLGIAIAIAAIPMLASNGALLLGLSRTKQSKSPCNVYITLTAIFGCASSLTGLPLYALLFLSYHNRRVCLLENVSIFLVQTASHVVVYGILMLAIDRYFFVRPNSTSGGVVTKWLLSKSGSLTMLAAVLTISVIHGLVAVNFFDNIKNTYIKLLMFIINALIVLGVYTAYLKLYCEVRSHTASIRSFSLSESRDQHPSASPRHLREFIKTISIILTAGIFCYCPFIVMDSLTGWYTLVKKSAAPRNIRFGYYFSTIPIFLNFTINALLLIYRNDKVLHYLKARICLRSHRRVDGPGTCLPLKEFGYAGRTHETMMKTHNEAVCRPKSIALAVPFALKRGCHDSVPSLSQPGPSSQQGSPAMLIRHKK